MSFKVTLYTFRKKENSTKRPSDGGVEMECVLKDDCGIISPVISVKTMENPCSYNYAHIPTFGRFYFIEEWKWIKGLWQAFLVVDALASWRSEIGSTDQYILRSSSAYNPTVIDNLYPAKTGCEFAMKTATWAGDDWAFAPDSGRGTYIVGIVNNDPSVNGTISYYALTGGQMAGLRAYMLGSIKSWEDITALTGDIAKAFIDPFQYIVSCLWFPFDIPGGEQTELKFGFWNSGLHGAPLGSFTITKSFVISRPVRTDGAERGDWLMISPFADYYLTIYPWGVIPIDGTSITSAGLKCTITIDLITGLSVLRIQANSETVLNNDKLLSSHTAQLGVQMQIAQVSTDYTGLVSAGGGGLSGIFSSLGGAITAGLSATMLGQSVGNIASATLSAMSHGSVSGSAGGVTTATLGGSAYFIAKFFFPVDEYNEEKGRPLCAVKKPENIPGFMICENGDISLPSTKTEQEKIKNYLEGGFYFE